MAQAGMHAMLGSLARKWTSKTEWLLLGALLGSFIPDMDNVGVAVATVMKLPKEGIHRTMTHSLFFIVAVMAVFFIISQVKKQPRWNSLGIGLGVGILLHILLDLLLWFNGVSILWPIPLWINLWANVTPPEWFMKFMDPAEFLWMLANWARKYGTNGDYQKTLRNWMIFQIVLFVVFTPLAYIMTKGFLTIFGALYLISIFMGFFVTIRMRQTVEAAG
jgi:membrane-bound metal-dependent hydrolase YbcI (DUF457 family)